VVASGSCLKSTSICCKEGEVVATLNLKANGEGCGGDNECVSGHCYGQASVWQGGGMGAGFASAVNQAQYGKTCQAISAKDLNEPLQETQIKGTLIGLQVVLSFTPAGPIIQIISAGVQGVQAIYTCGQLAQVNANPNIDAGTKANFKNACVTSSISAATGLIGGGASAVSTFAGSSLSAGSQLALSGVGMIDNVGNVVVSGMNANNVCQLYGSNSWQCMSAIANAGIAVGSSTLSVNKFVKSSNMYREQQRLTSYYDSVLNSLSPEYLDRLEGLPKQGMWPHKDNLPTTLSSTDYPDDFVRVYRGIKDPNTDPRTNLQLADLFRADKHGWWLDNDLNPDQIKLSLELIQNQDIDVSAIGYGHKKLPAGSPFLGFSTDHDIALNFATSQQGGQIITADIPRSELYDLEAMHQNITGELFGNSGHERELGIFGFLDPQYIVEVTSVPPIVY
jgi:hypothetical protein